MITGDGFDEPRDFIRHMAGPVAKYLYEDFRRLNRSPEIIPPGRGMFETWRKVNNSSGLIMLQGYPVNSSLFS